MLSFIGGLKRKYIYFGEENEPTMMVYRPVIMGRSALITLPAAYKYSDPQGMEEKTAVLNHCIGIARTLGLPEDMPTAAQLAMFIADGLDDLVRMKPFDRKKVVEGEFSGYVNGERVSGEVLH